MKTSLLNLVESRVARFRRSVGLSDAEAVNINSLLLKLRLLTLYRPLSDSFSGMSMKSGDNKFMLVNSNQPLCRQHFTIAHELYHLFMEEQQGVSYGCCSEGRKSESEQCADAFALMFLMPADGVRQLIPDEELSSGKVTMASVLRVGQYFAVSHKAVLNRLVDLNLISRADRELFMQGSVMRIAREYGYDTALYLPGNEGLVIGDFGEKARRLFDAEKISEGHYLELLHKIGIDDCEN
jgi:Zn-dependent peptidase ImmA (M78 family)